MLSKIPGRKGCPGLCGACLFTISLLLCCHHHCTANDLRLGFGSGVQLPTGSPVAVNISGFFSFMFLELEISESESPQCN